MIDVHPAPEQLAAFRVGKLGEDELAEIEAHVAQCDSCCQSLKKLPANDSFISLVRQATDTTLAPDSSAVDKGQATWNEADTTITGHEDEVPSDLCDHPRYEVLEKLGQGGMGVVYKARHRLMERVVALKVLNPRLLDRPASVLRFQREFKGAARLVHANIVTAFDAEQAGQSHFLAMEFVPGISLARLVEENGPLPIAQACDYVRQVALGLQHASERGMVHRDIKPQNLMVMKVDGPREVVKILDFGLARFVSESIGELPAGAEPGDLDSRLTQASTVMGTPDYIAPEQAQSASAADIRADIYSLGCTLYFLLAGHAPFPHGSALQKIKAHHEETPKPLNEIRPEVPAELVQVVERMLAKDPAQRFQTPAEVATALAPFAAAETPAVTIQAGEKKKRHIPFPRFSLATSILLVFGLLLYLFVPAVRDVVQSAIRLAMNKGVLIIEANDEDLEITIKQGGKDVVKAVVVDKKTKRTFELTAGNGEIRVRDKDATFWVRKFELQRGERVVFTAQALVDPQWAKNVISILDDQEERDRRLIATFGPDEQPISRLGVVAEDEGWRIDVQQPEKNSAQPALESRSVLLFEVVNPRVQDCLVVFQITMKSKFAGKGSAYPILGCLVPGQEATFSKTPNHWVSGTTDWATYEASFRLEKGPMPSQLKLYVWVGGEGSVWVKNLAVSKGPLPAEEKSKEPWRDPTVLHFSRLKHARVRDVADAVNQWLRDNGWNRPDVSVGMSSDLLTNSLTVQVFYRDKSLSEAISQLVKRLDNPKADGEFLQGHWLLVMGEENGVRIPREIIDKTKPFKFSGERMRFSHDGKEYEGTFKLDPTKNPKSIDVSRVEGNRTIVHKGIYLFEFDARRLKLCLGGPGEDRPGGFGAPLNGTKAQYLTLAWIPQPIPQAGYQPLFNDKDLAGWKGDPKFWKVQDKALIFRGQFLSPSPLRTEKAFENYILRFDHWVEPIGSQVSGTGIHKTFFTLLLDEPTAEEAGVKERERARVRFYQGGRLEYGVCNYKGRPLAPLREFSDKKAKTNGWNQVEVHHVGGQIEVICNGQSMACFPSKTRNGYIGLAPADGDWRGEWSFRNVEIQVLPGDTKPPRGTFRPLFPAKNMNGWKGQTQACTWTAEDLKIVATNGPGYTYVWTEKKFRDYELKFQLKFPQVNSYFGVQPRRKNTTDPLARGEIDAMHLEYRLLGEGAKEPVPQGPASTRFKRGKEFNDIVVKCVGKHITVLVNGETVRDEEVAELPVEGALTFCVASAFQLPEAVLRNLEIRELPSDQDKLPEKKEKALQPLFNGKDLADWKGDPKEWKVQDKTLIFHGKESSLLQTEKAFQNYVLRFEHWVEPREGGNPPYLNLHLHYPTADEMRDKDRDRPLVHFYADGMVHYGPRDYKLRPLVPTMKTLARKHKKFGWNKVEVHSRSGELEIFVNGESVALMHPGKARGGAIALEPHWGEYSFRNVEIQVLPADAGPTFRPLFNGKDLTGWEGDKDSCTWKDDRLVMKAGDKRKRTVYLWTKRPYQDFELRFDYYHATINGIVRVIPHGKVVPKDAVHGTEALKIHWVGTPSGGSPNNQATARSNQFAFNSVTITCKDKVATTEVNGAVVGEERLERTEGVLAFQLVGDGEQEAILRNVWIRELASNRAEK